MTGTINARLTIDIQSDRSNDKASALLEFRVTVGTIHDLEQFLADCVKTTKALPQE